MSEPSSLLERLSEEAVWRLEEACCRFEAAWQAGCCHPLEDFLAGAEGDERLARLRELVRLEVYYRRRAGEGPSAADYETRFPEATAVLQEVFALPADPDRPEAPSGLETVADPGPVRPGVLPTSANEGQASIGGKAQVPGEPGGTPQAAEGIAARLPAPVAPIGASSAARLPVIPGYEVLDKVRWGGMGVVYKARQVGLRRLAALKLIRAGVPVRAAELARFRAEAETVARLRHPGIVQVYAVGEHNGRPYIALEFVDGGTLAERLDGTPFPAERAAGLAETLARAVEVAHQHGIVHRDLNPANVLLTDDRSPKVTDFGLARRLDEAGQTLTGEVLGTPGYMAPEQAAGNSKDAGPAADIYALGAILYALLTGRPPFQGATPLQTIRRMAREQPVPPRRLRPGLPRDLQAICLKCLARQPGHRYATALELADDLRRFLDGQPVRARRPPARQRAGRWARRWAVLTPVIVALLALGWAGYRWLPPEPAQEKAEQAADPLFDVPADGVESRERLMITGPRRGYWLNRVAFTRDGKQAIAAGGAVIRYDLDGVRRSTGSWKCSSAGSAWPSPATAVIS
jgi:hypothetical protein